MDFAKKIADEFNIRGIKWDQEGGYGYYTDTAVFMDAIEECTNISAGGFKEHYNTEWVDLNYTYQVYQTALEMDWEDLPTVRELEDRFSEEETDSKVDAYQVFTQNKNTKEITAIFKLLGLSATRNTLKDGVRHLTYSKWLEDVDFDVYLKGDKILLNNEESSMSDLKTEIMTFFKDDLLDEIDYYIDLYKKEVKGADVKLVAMYKTFGYNNLNKLIKDLESL
jgi:hypothetical protein